MLIATGQTVLFVLVRVNTNCDNDLSLWLRLYTPDAALFEEKFPAPLPDQVPELVAPVTVPLREITFAIEQITVGVDMLTVESGAIVSFKVSLTWRHKPFEVDLRIRVALPAEISAEPGV